MVDFESSVDPRSEGRTSPRGCVAHEPFIYNPSFEDTGVWTKCLKNIENTVLDTLARICGSSRAELFLWTRASEV
jgi:hypothetical protein